MYIFFLQFCLKWLDKYLFRRTLAFFCSQSTSPATWSWGGFGMWTGTSQVVGHVYIQKDIVLILKNWGKGSRAALDRVRLHEEKSLKRQQVITYCVVASVQVPVIAWLIKNRNNPSSFSLMDSEVILAIWKRLLSRSVSEQYWFKRC